MWAAGRDRPGEVMGWVDRGQTAPEAGLGPLLPWEVVDKEADVEAGRARVQRELWAGPSV